ncbi:hypothetical protein AHAS_Ahas07G0111000 [Arachis hypogaea]
MREGSNEEVLGEVEVEEGAAEGDVRGENVVDGVVEEGEGGEIAEAAEGVRGEWAKEVGRGEVEGDNGVRVAGDTEPFTGVESLMFQLESME